MSPMELHSCSEPQAKLRHSIAVRQQITFRLNSHRDVEENESLAGNHCTAAGLYACLHLYRVWAKVREPSEHLRKRAAECFACGTNALTERARRTWLSMAQLWLQLAERAEQAQSDTPTGGTSVSASPQTSAPDHHTG